MINGSTDMEAVWGRASGRCITLWCRLAEVSHLGLTRNRPEKLSPLLCSQQTSETEPRRETFLLALHTYDSPNPEDLTFQQGDKILLLSKGGRKTFLVSNDYKKQDSAR